MYGGMRMTSYSKHVTTLHLGRMKWGQPKVTGKERENLGLAGSCMVGDRLVVFGGTDGYEVTDQVRPDRFVRSGGRVSTARQAARKHELSKVHSLTLTLTLHSHSLTHFWLIRENSFLKAL